MSADASSPDEIDKLKEISLPSPSSPIDIPSPKSSTYDRFSKIRDKKKEKELLRLESAASRTLLSSKNALTDVLSNDPQVRGFLDTNLDSFGGSSLPVPINQNPLDLHASTALPNFSYFESHPLYDPRPCAECASTNVITRVYFNRKLHRSFFLCRNCAEDFVIHKGFEPLG